MSETFVVRPRKGHDFLEEAMNTYYPSSACPSRLEGPFLSIDQPDVVLKCGLSREGGEKVWRCQTHRAEAFMGSDAVMGWVDGQPPSFCVLAEALGEQYHQWCRMVERLLIPLSNPEGEE